jgi:predicted RNA-binding protein with PUA-like domain
MAQMKQNHWIVKQEPETYSWEDLVRDGKTDWTGVRNFQARNNLRSMKPGDKVLFYHSGKEKAIVGIAEVVNGPYAESTKDAGEWTAVDIKPVKPFAKAVSLSTIKSEPRLAEVALIRQSRLSVVPLTKEEFDFIVKLGSS